MQESFCLHCGAAFVKKANSQKFCSPECRKRADKKRNPRRRIIVCKACGQEFLFRGNSTPPSRCKPCRDAWRAENKARKAAKAGEKAARENEIASLIAAHEWRELEDRPGFSVSENGLLLNMSKNIVLKYREFGNQMGTSFGPTGKRDWITQEVAARAFVNGSYEASKLTREEIAARAAAADKPSQQARYDETDAKVLEAWNSGLNAKQIREKLNLGENTVTRHLHANGIFPQKIIEEKAAEKRANASFHWPSLNERGKAWTDITGAEYQDLDALKIYARDGNACYICGRTLSRAGGRNAPLYPTVDHVIPLSAGGSHTYENTRACCRQCNVKKGTRSIEEVTCCA